MKPENMKYEEHRKRIRTEAELRLKAVNVLMEDMKKKLREAQDTQKEMILGMHSLKQEKMTLSQMVTAEKRDWKIKMKLNEMKYEEEKLVEMSPVKKIKVEFNKINEEIEHECFIY